MKSTGGEAVSQEKDPIHMHTRPSQLVPRNLPGNASFHILTLCQRRHFIFYSMLSLRLRSFVILALYRNLRYHKLNGSRNSSSVSVRPFKTKALRPRYKISQVVKVFSPLQLWFFTHHLTFCTLAISIIFL